MGKKLVAAGAGLGFCLFLSAAGSARMLKDVSPRTFALPKTYRVAACAPSREQCTHRVGRLWFTVTNYGFFGNQIDPVNNWDCLTGGRSSSAEFPGGSRIEYLFQGALWVGAVVGTDTLVSLGTDGWLYDSERGELHPDCEGVGNIERRSANSASPYYHPKGVSDLDIIAVLYDTLTDPAFVETTDPNDNKPYKPMGLKIIQSSYSWAAGWGQDWVMLNFEVVNIGRKPLSNVYLGVFVDADVGPLSSNDQIIGFDDDLSGFKVDVPNEVDTTCPTDTINLAHVYDANPTFSANSPTSVTGIRVVRAPIPLKQVKTSFNWWTPNGTDILLDWGPHKTPGRRNFAGGLGQPEGDAQKYHMLSNGEFDYDQVFSVIDQSATDYGFGAGWLPPLNPLDRALNIANGFDTRYLVSFGPFNLKPLADDPSDTLRLTLGYIAGLGFHRDPTNYGRNLADNAAYFQTPERVQAYLDGLDFRPVATNARWVARVFDNETVVESVLCGGNPPRKIARLRGDGIPDFKGPLPPPLPKLEVYTNQGEVVLRWFGRNTENVLDGFTADRDFEGYRVQMSPDGQNYTIIGSYDRVDWKVHYLDQSVSPPVWKPHPLPPLTYDEIQRFFAVNEKDPSAPPQSVRGWDIAPCFAGDTFYNYIDSVSEPGKKKYIIRHPIDPNKFNVPIPPRTISSGGGPRGDLTKCNPDTAFKVFRIHYCQSCGPFSSRVDSFYYFAPVDYNLGLDAAKLYPTVTDTSNDSAYWYEYRISGLFPSQPVYLAITPFDFGKQDPSTNLEPLEATPGSAARLIYALPNEQTRLAESLKISVYPNPYRVDNDYGHFENPNQEIGRDDNLHRQLHFINLPSRCVIRIYTLDGDLVQEILHDKDPNAPDAGYEQWNLLTRNAQSVSAGLYLYTVQSSQGIWTENGLKNTHVGKIIIIK